MIRSVLHQFISPSLALLLGLLLSACGEKRPAEAELMILYTSDVLNYTLPYDFLHDAPSQVSLANFCTLEKQRREEYGELCLVLDNGNKFLGTVPAGYYNYINQETEPLAFRTERIIGYDAVGIGDKDLDVPHLLHPAYWNPAIQPPILCANLIKQSTQEPIFQPYKIFKRNGLRIAVLGLVSPILMSWLPQEEWSDIDIEDMIESAAKWMPVLQAEHPDLVVGLFGSTFAYQSNGNTLDSYKNPHGSVPVAIRVPGFDLVLMGGSSERDIFEVRNDAGKIVTCIQIGTTCSHCGEIRIEMTRQETDEYQKNIEAKIVDLKQYQPDAEYCASMSGVQDTIASWLYQKFGVLGDTLYGGDGYYQADKYRQLIHKAQLWFTSADISLATCLIGNDTIMPGEIGPLTMFKLYPFSNFVEVIEMQGLDVVQYLEYAVGMQFATMNSADDPLLALQYDQSGNPVCNEEGIPCLANSPRDFTSAAGISYTIDVTQPVGHRITVVSMSDGTPFNPRETYKVAINSYLGKDGAQIFSKGLGWDFANINLHAVPRPQYSVRHVLQEYIKAFAGEIIHVSTENTWKIIPESYAKKAIARERKLPLPTR